MSAREQATGSCWVCGADIGGGPGGWFSLFDGSEVCSGPSPTSFHEPLEGPAGAILAAVRAWTTCGCDGLKRGAHFADCTFNEMHDQGFADVVLHAIECEPTLTRGDLVSQIRQARSGATGPEAAPKASTGECGGSQSIVQPRD